MSTGEQNTISYAMGIDAANTVAGMLKALAEPLRLRMLSAIVNDPRGEVCVDDLMQLAQVSQPTLSHHLKVLKNTGLLLSERRGTWVWYRVDPQHHATVSALLDGLAPQAVHKPVQTQSTEEPPVQSAEDLEDELIKIFAVHYPEASVDTVKFLVRESYAGLLRSSANHTVNPEALERFVAQRLKDIYRSHNRKIPQVLFVCVQNAGRSQLAAKLLNERSAGKIHARSAGSHPAPQVHAKVRDYVDAQAFPKPLTDDAVRASDVVITMGCGDICPIIDGVRYENWPIADPALASDEGFERIRAEITERIDALIPTLLPRKS